MSLARITMKISNPIHKQLDIFSVIKLMDNRYIFDICCSTLDENDDKSELTNLLFNCRNNKYFKEADKVRLATLLTNLSISVAFDFDVDSKENPLNRFSLPGRIKMAMCLYHQDVHIKGIANSNDYRKTLLSVLSGKPASNNSDYRQMLHKVLSGKPASAEECDEKDWLPAVMLCYPYYFYFEEVEGHHALLEGGSGRFINKLKPVIEAAAARVNPYTLRFFTPKEITLSAKDCLLSGKGFK